MKLNFKNASGDGVRNRNKGAISLEYILVIVVVVLACLVGMKVFGGKVGDTINNSKNAVVNTTNNVFNQLGNETSGGDSGSGGSSESGTNYVMLEYPTTIETSDTSALFRSDAEYSKFVSVKVDDNVIAETNYTVTEGSTIVVLKQSYISTLSAGNHTLTIQSTDGYASSDFNVSEASTGVDMTSINVTDGSKVLAAGDFSTKGNLVTINDTQYRVLSVDGTQVKVMSMVNIGNSAFNNPSVTTSFGSYTGQKYADSKLDQAMTTYYNGLPEAIKTAIVEQNINQTMYSSTWDVPTGSLATSIASDNDDYIVEKKGEINVGSRKVYALDVDDVLEYLGLNFTWKQLNKMVFDTESTVNRFVWLRSARSDDSSDAFFVSGGYGLLGNYYYYSSNEVRPAFVLDLNLLS